MKILSKVLSVIILSILFLNIFSTVSFAQTTSSISLPAADPGVPMDVNTLTQSIFLSGISFLTCAVEGVSITSQNHKCLGYNQTTGKLGYTDNSQGLNGMLADGISATFTKPITSGEYLSYLSSNFGLTKNAYAANATGFDQLSPLMNIWIAMRNVAYLLFVLIFVAIGFAIMIRAKIDPRTVMSIENQIPKLIIALILITFSFAIAGLVIDFMWVMVYVIINLFVGLDPVLKSQIGSITQAASTDPFSMANSLNNGFGGFFGLATQAAGGIKDITNTLSLAFFSQNNIGVSFIRDMVLPVPVFAACLAGLGGNMLGSIIGANSNTFILGGLLNLTGEAGKTVDFGACLNGGVATMLSTIGGIIAFIIFSIALLVVLIKLWWTLIKAYALFIIYVIFGPLMIMGGVIPGSKVNFENWVRHIIAYLAVFPTAIAILLLGKVIMDTYSSPAGTRGFTPPLIGAAQGTAGSLGPLLGFAIIMLLPQALTMVQDALSAPDMKYLAGVGQSIGVGAKYYGNAAGGIINRAWRPRDTLHNLDEGWARKLLMPVGSFQRKIIVGKEVDYNGHTFTKPNPPLKH
ncbi:MAG TPA: hypothetical protein VN711_01220 [Candidatus Saccharimonadales bacterium]|nr:hypothetical protein [Candidatus Saccharimonadales bacterium]